jgi:hypothetical protein
LRGNANRELFRGNRGFLAQEQGIFFAGTGN